MDSKLVFLCGFPSSGTDLLKNILNAHPDVSISGEFPFLPSLGKKYGDVVSADAVNDLIADMKKLDPYHNFQNLNWTIEYPKREYSLAEIYSRMLSDIERKWKGNKTPQNTENIDKLKRLFPDAKFIIIVRDIRDVALSWNKKWGKDQLLCATKWDARMRRGYQLIQQFRHDCLLVKYESLLGDFRTTTGRMCSFLGIEFHENLCEFDKRVHKLVEGKLNYGKPLLTTNQEKWRKEMDRARVLRIEEISWRALKLFGYSIQVANRFKGITPIETVVGFARDISALMFVGNRAIRRNRLHYRLATIVFEVKKLLVMRYGMR